MVAHNSKTKPMYHIFLLKKQGVIGIGLPHLKEYFWGCQLTILVDWNIHSTHKDWIGLETGFCASVSGVPTVDQPKIQTCGFMNTFLWALL